jgi:hypothetical protein
MSGGDIKTKYFSASLPFDVTHLHSLASSATWIAGWFSDAIVNTTDLNCDYLYGGTFTTHASNRQVGYIFVYVIASLNDTPTWPAAATGTIGTEGTGSFTGVEMRDSLCRLLIPPILVTATASQIYTFPQTGIAQLFGGNCPTHHGLFIAQNCTTTTTAGFASSGSAIYCTPVMGQYT